MTCPPHPPINISICPPRSPDLTSVDLFLWGYVKNIVYLVNINDLKHLQARIRDAVATVTPNTLQAWIFVVPPREPTFKFIEKDIYAEKNFDSFLCSGVTH
jgi:hypothetical protein